MTKNKRTINELSASKAMQEVWDWKEKAYEATKDMTFEQLQEHYKKVAQEVALLLGSTIIQTGNGSYKFAK